MNTTDTPAPDYGEPWEINSRSSEVGDTGDYDGVEEIYTRDKVVRAISWNPEDEDTEAFKRIVACVNACAGVADPAAHMAAMREAIREAHAALAKTGRCLSIWHNASGSLCQTKDADAIADAELALTKLQPFLDQ
jgi:hypothetical protein